MAEKPSGLKGVFLRNKGAKIASVFLAFVAWYAIQAVISFETVVSDIPIDVSLAPGWAVLDRSARTVDVLFRGPQEDIRYLDRDRIEVKADVKGDLSAGTITIPLQAKDVKAPGAVRPVLLRPGEITLQLDRDAEKQVPVKADLQSAPPEGYEVEKVVCTPASVTLQGPQRRLGEIESVRTAPIDLEGRSRTFKKLKMSIVQPSETWVAQVTPSNVVVEITIVERAATRELVDQPVNVLVAPGTRPRVDIWPKKVSVIVRGRAELLKGLKESDVQAYVDCSALEPGTTYDLPVQVQTVSGLSPALIEPPTVKLTLEEQ